MDELEPINRWNAIESAGGPLLLLPRAAMHAWTGVREPSVGHRGYTILGAQMLRATGTDYDRACSIDGYLGTLSVGDDEALVIGDAPASTILIPSHLSTSLVIAKWEWGPDVASVVASLRQIRLEQFPQAEVTFTFRSSSQVLFDSACAGDEVDEFLTSHVPAGTYVASTLVFRPSDDISLVLHWVRRSDDATQFSTKHR